MNGMAKAAHTVQQCQLQKWNLQKSFFQLCRTYVKLKRLYKCIRQGGMVSGMLSLKTSLWNVALFL